MSLVARNLRMRWFLEKFSQVPQEKQRDNETHFESDVDNKIILILLIVYVRKFQQNLKFLTLL